MKTNKLQVLFMLIIGMISALFFGTIIGGGDNELTFIASLIAFVSAFIVSYGYTPKEKKKMAFALCAAINNGITLSCTNKLKSGVIATFYMGNTADIQSVTYSSTNEANIEDIVMKAGKVMYQIDGQLSSTLPTQKLKPGKYANQVDHQIVFNVFNKNLATKKVLNDMLNAEVFCIVQYKWTGTNGYAKYGVIGIGAGLRMVDLTEDPLNAETPGYVITLKSSDDSPEAVIIPSLWETDEATTDAKIAVLADL